MAPIATARPHPLQPLSDAEILRARDILSQKHGQETGLFFRAVYLEEPPRADLTKFLAAEHGGKTPEVELPRLAKCQYDLIKSPEKHQLSETVVDLNSGETINHVEHPAHCQTSYTVSEFGNFQEACVASEMFKEALTEFEIPSHMDIRIDPWPYGGLDPEEDAPRYMQGLVFAHDTTHKNPDSNHYAYPLPIIPVMDFVSKKIVRIDRLATGGKDDGLKPEPRGDKPKKLFANIKPAEYVPELLDGPMRSDMKPINIVQPDGASFTVKDGSLVEWQKWRFRVGFTPREGAVLHDICYENRPIFFRLSFSEMTVPYGDPRPPFHRKQAFDFGDGGAGRAANNLNLGCDCLGAIHYFDAWTADGEGKPALAQNVVCLHEQDNGIGWKHTNYRTDRAVVVRLRELVLQFVITLANYEYIFAYKLDTAGGITLETRATGILSVVGIDEGKTSAYGNIVSPGAMAQNHQHIFAVRIDPAIDSYDAGETSIVLEESHPMPISPETNPNGNGYEVRRIPVTRAMYTDAEPKLNRMLKMENKTKTNEISGKNVSYKFAPSATQLMLADPASTQAKRAPFARHHLWVTGYRDGELWAAGEFTNQSREESGGVKAMVNRADWFSEGIEKFGGDWQNGSSNGDGTADKGRLSTPVVWSVFGFTHNPRVEDWPVMPVEIHQTHIRPVDFFTRNPALDIPSTKNAASVLLSPCGKGKRPETPANSKDAQKDPVAHLQGNGPDIDPKSVGNSPTREKSSPTAAKDDTKNGAATSSTTSAPATGSGKEKDKEKKRLSMSLNSLFSRKKKDDV